MPESKKTPFQLKMSRSARILGWCYVPLHIFVLPLLLSVFSAVSVWAVDDVTINIVYYGLGTAYVLLFLGRFLRADFDSLLDHKLANLLSCISAYFLNVLLSYAAVIVLELIVGNIVNPNQEALESMTQTDYSTIYGLAVFIGPLVEETLFRGVVFGTLREKNRALAYIISTLLFSFYHVWQYALACGDAALLIYIIQYIPTSIALAWLYEKSSSIWMPVFFHMGINALALVML